MYRHVNEAAFVKATSVVPSVREFGVFSATFRVLCTNFSMNEGVSGRVQL